MTRQGLVFACDVRGCDATTTVTLGELRKGHSPKDWGWTTDDNGKPLCMCKACYPLWLENLQAPEPPE